VRSSQSWRSASGLGQRAPRRSPARSARPARWPRLGLALAAVGAAALPGLCRLDRTLAGPMAAVALLRSPPAFALLPPLEVERLALRLRTVRREPGEVVITQGEPGDWFGVVTEGELDVVVDGRHVTVLRAGASFGEIALLHAIPRSATVTARTPVALQVLDHEPFLAAMRHQRARASADAVAAARLARAAPSRPAQDSAPSSPAATAQSHARRWPAARFPGKVNPEVESCR
jgi:hypothetical protein